jgi:hypothetical protein
MPLKSSILKVLAYFDLFNYPISREEVVFFLDSAADEAGLSAALEKLLEERRIFWHQGFFSLRDDRSLVARRLKGNAHAETLLSIAARNSRFLFQFPFVRGIGISGSLSKNYADENADIDYFIITRSNRLWIARTLMHLFKKLTFLTGSQHRYCMNYFIDEQALEIPEKNEFTAIELITLKPFCGNGSVDRFFYINRWANDYYPNSIPGSGCKRMIVKDSLLKRAMELLFSNALGNWLDNYFLEVTSRRWKKKEDEKRLNIKGNRMGLQTSKHYAKPNPVFFQKKTMARFTEKLQELGITLPTDDTTQPSPFQHEPPSLKRSFSSVE